MDKEDNLENSNREEIRIGALLRTEREKKGISCRRLSEIIKIREQLIDALENEEWEKLPARVFIKGFIRSYTIAIGYDTKKALRLFDRCLPSKGEENPRTLIQRPKRGKGIYYIIILLLLLAAAIYSLRVYLKTDNAVEAPRTAIDSPAATTVTEAEEPLAVKIETPIQTPVEPTEYIPAAASQNAPLAQNETGDLTGIPVDQPAQNAPPEVITPSEAETGSPENSPDTQPVTGNALVATVSMRTWVKIIADDTPPKEYIFLPGARHSWTAERGFDVTIGNAGGIEFSFNGETIRNIGELGEVKKLRFPNNFQTKWEE